MNNVERKSQADHILYEFGLLKKLEKIGVPHVIGSYRMDMMAWNDLDIDIENDKLTSRSWGVSNSYKVEKLNQLIRGWINYFKIGRMKKICGALDRSIRYRLRMCIWKHWKTPKNRAKNLIKLGVNRKKAFATAYAGYRIARVCRGTAISVAISNERLNRFGLVSMLDYYTEKSVTC